MDQLAGQPIAQLQLQGERDSLRDFALDSALPLKRISYQGAVVPDFKVMERSRAERCVYGVFLGIVLESFTPTSCSGAQIGLKRALVEIGLTTCDSRADALGRWGGRVLCCEF